MVVTVASTSAVRCTGSALRAAVIRIAVTGGLTVLACVFGSAVANAATSSDVPPPSTIANTLQSDVSDLVNGLLKDLGAHQHHHLVGLPGGGASSTQPPADDADNSGAASSSVHPSGPPPSSSSGSGDSASSGQSGSGSDSGSDSDVWTGSTTVTVPTRTTPPAPEAPAPPAPPAAAPVHVQPAPPPVTHSVEQQVQKPTEPSMGAPVGVVPDLPRYPIELPIQQPAAQPISSPSTGGTASHDLGSANGIADIAPSGAGFRPNPGSTTDEYSARRVSDGVPGLPSTSPD